MARSQGLSTTYSSSLPSPGSCLLGGEEVHQPPGHYNDQWKPENHDPHRIYVSPSMKYCCYHDVYTKRHGYEISLSLSPSPPHLHTHSLTLVLTLSPRFMFEGRRYEGRVCFKVLIDPKSYDVSAVTVATTRDQVIDEDFSLDELEWSTKSDRAVYLYALLIQVSHA